MASAHSTSWAEADATSPNRDRALAVSRMVLGSIIRGAVEIRATPPLGAGSLEPLQCPTYHGSSVIRASSSRGLIGSTATAGKPLSPGELRREQTNTGSSDVRFASIEYTVRGLPLLFD